MRRLGALIICAALLTALTVPAAALGNGQLVQDMRVGGHTLQVVCPAVDDGEFTVTLDGGELEVTRYTSGELDMPITVYCLVDVSGSMSDGQMQQARDTLTALNNAMDEGDSMVITTLGNDTVSSGILYTGEERTDAISALARDNTQDTNLYKGIVDSISDLTTNASYNTRRCLVILSDGEDDQRTGITEGEATDAVRASGIPVYTVATVRSADKTEYAKVLGSFARNSLGGIHYAPTIDGTTATDAGTDIWRDLQNAVVLRAELLGADYDNTKQQVPVVVKYTSGDTRVTEERSVDTKELPDPVDDDEDTQTPPSDGDSDAAPDTDRPNSGKEDIPSPPPNDIEDTDTDDTADDDTESVDDESENGEDEENGDGEEEEEEKGFFAGIPWYIYVAAGVLIVGAVVLVVLVRRKKKSEPIPVQPMSPSFGPLPDFPSEVPPEDDDAEPDIEPDNEPEQMTGYAKVEETTNPPAEPIQPPTEPPEPPEREAGCQVTMISIGRNERICAFPLPDRTPVTLGRDGRRANVVPDSTDMKLSGVHCQFQRNGRAVYVRDCDSTNDSFINGVPIHGKEWMPILDGDALRIGTSEYRVRFDF